MDYTRSLKSAVKKARISIQEKIFADLMIVGWKEQDAYVAAFGYQINYDENYVRTQMRNTVSNPDFVKYMESKGKKLEKAAQAEAEGDLTDDELLSKATKEETLKELMQAKQKMRAGSREWLDATKLIADLQQMKKDTVEDEDTTIHFYLPLQCNMCAFNPKNKKE